MVLKKLWKFFRNSNDSQDEKSEDRKEKNPEVEVLEPRIMLSATWVDADTDEVVAGPSISADIFSGTAEADVADALAGDDQLFGMDGDDTLSGGSGDDLLHGGAGDDTLDGGADNDVLISGGGDDTLNGGSGLDTFRFTEAQDGDVVTVDGGEHADVIDLTEFGPGSVTQTDSSTLTVSLENGESFQISHSHVETAITADGLLDLGGGAEEANSGPEADAGADQVVDDSTTVTLDASGSSDPDNDSLTYQWNQVQGPRVTLTDSAAAQPSFTSPDVAEPTVLTFAVTVSDGNEGGVHTDFINVTVNPVDHAPVANGDTVVTDEDNAVTTGNVLTNDTDLDNDTLAVDSFTQPDHGSVVYNDDGTFTYTPDANYNGADSFTYTVTDGNGGTDTATVDVTVNSINDGPVAGGDTVSTAEDNAVTTGNVLTNDTDLDNDTLAVDSFTQPDHGTVVYNDDGTFTYTPDEHYNGADSFTYTVTDGNGGTDTATVNVSVSAVNDNPYANLDQVTTSEDSTVTTGNVLANDLEADGDSMFMQNFTQPEHGTVSYNGDGTFTYTPDANYNGTDSFTYTIVDSTGLEGTGTVEVSVTAVNDDPNAAGDSVSTSEDQAVTTGNVLLNDTDLDGDTVSMDSFTQPDHGAVVYNDDGTFTYTPDENYHGSDSFTYTVSDGNGGTDTATVYVNVASVNDTPDAVDDSLTTNEDQSATTGDVLANDSDIDGDTLVLKNYTQAEHGSVSFNQDGTFTYTPDTNFNGTDTFSYTVSDGHGGTDTATVTVTVNAVNDAPDAVDDTLSAVEDTAVTTENVLANDTDIDGDALSVESFTQPDHGTVVYNDDGTFTYTPDANYNGSDSFTYTISDGHGGTDTATMEISVAAVNDTTVVTNDSFTTDEDTVYTTGNLMANDSDIDGDYLFVQEFTEPEHGSVAYKGGGVFTYTPDPDYHGNDSFTYTISDGNGSEVTATVDITVESVNDAPDTEQRRFRTTTTEDNPVTTYDVLDRFTDAEGDSFTISEFSQPNHGSVVYNDDGTFTYTPDANYHGNDSFTFTVSDGLGGEVEKTMRLVVGSVNDNPDLDPSSLTLDEGGAATTADLISAASDVDGDELLMNDFTQPENGSVTYNLDGTFTYTPDADYYGEDSFTYTLSDGHGGVITETVSVTVNEVPNNAPTATDDSLTTNEDHSATTVDVLANDTDPEGDTLSVNSYTQPDHGSVTYNDDGTFTYTPDCNYNGSDSFSYTVSDGEGNTDTALISVTVDAVNDNPDLAAPELTTPENTAVTTADLLAASSDPEGDTLALDSFTQADNGTVVDNGDGTFTYTPDADFYGEDTFTYTVTDGEGGSATETVTVMVARDGNIDPVATGEAFTTDEDTAITTGNVLANDTDTDGDTLSVKDFSQPAHGTVTYNGDGTFTYTPDSNYNGSDSFTYTVSDGVGGTDTATINLTVDAVNDDPNANINTFTTAEDTELTTGNVLTNDTDPEGDTLSLDSFTQPDHGTVTYNEDGTFTYTPDENYNGADSFTYTISDGQGGTDTGTVQVNVTAVDDAVQVGDDSISGTENQSATSVNVFDNDSEVDGDSYWLSDYSQPDHGEVSYNGDGTFTYTPNKNFNGSDSFTYQVMDENGVQSTATVTVTVGAANSLPELVPTELAVDEDNSATTVNVLDQAEDEDGDTLTISSFTQPEHGSVAHNGDGTFTYTPDENYNGTDSFTYTVSDGQGGLVTGTVDVDVAAVNDAVVGVGDSVVTDEDNAVTTGNVLANDTDIDGDTLFVSNFSQPDHGSVVYNEDGTFTYTPDANYNGADSFTYTVMDEAGAQDTVTVDVTVNSVNDAPETEGESLSTSEDTPTTTGNVLANDTDVDDDTLSVDSFTQADNGTVVYNEDGTFTYTPDQDFHGTDTFTYTVTDGNGETDTATVTVYVSSVNDAPEAALVQETTAEDTPFTTANVIDASLDVDGDTMLVNDYTQPEHGEVNYNGDGTFTYTPDANYNGADSFTYTLSDGKGGVHTGTVEVTVSAVNDDPYASGNSFATDEDNAVTTGDVLANDYDVDGDVLTITGHTDPANGSVNYNGDGTYTYTPDADFNGSDSFTYTVSDGHGGTDTATVYITVNSVNDTPDAVTDTFTLDEDTILTTGNVLANDTDVDGDLPLLNDYSQPEHGSVIYNYDGTFTYNPDSNFNGSDSFTYTISDGHGGTTTGTVNLNVNAVNDGPDSHSDSFTTSEDTALTTGNVINNDTDVDGDTLQVSDFTDPAHGQVVYNDDGTFSYTPDEHFSGTDTFQYTISDGAGGTDTSTITITVTGVADTPTLGVADTAGLEDGAIPLDITSTLVDTDGSETQSIQISGMPSGSTLSAGTNNGNGSWTLTPAQLDNLTITPPAHSDADFQLTVTATSTETGGDTASTSQTLDVSVTAVADAAVVNVTDATGSEDTAIALDITSTLADADGSETQEVVISGVPAGAVLSAGADNGDGSYTLTAGQLDGLSITPPTDSDADFELTVVTTTTDSNGDTATTTRTLDVTVAAVADAPDLTVADSTGAEDTAISLDITSTLTDTDGSETQSVLISGVPTGSVLSAGTDNGDGSWTLTPAQLDALTITPPANSDTDFQLTVAATSTDVGGDTSTTTQTLDVTVTAVIDAPTLDVSDAAGSEDTAITLDITSSLTDTDGSETLAITISDVPTGAVLSAGTDNGDGTWTLTPAQLDSLTITPPANSDTDFQLSVTTTATETATGESHSLTESLDVTVAAVADAADLSVADAAGDEDTAIALDITSTLTDTDGSETQSVLISGVPAGSVLSAGTDNADGSWTLTPAQLDNLTITPPAHSDTDFQLTVATTATDTNGDTATTSRTLDVTVNAVADQTTVSVADATGAEDTAIALDITSTLVDTDGSEDQAIVISGVPGGAVLSAGTDNGDGTWALTPAQLEDLTITPPADSDDDFQLEVTATTTDVNGDTTTSSQTLDVTVTAVADAPDLTVADSTGDEDTAIPLDITSTLTDTDGSETQAIVISGVPEGAELSAGILYEDGTWVLTPDQLEGLTLTPAQDSHDDFQLTVEAYSADNDESHSVTSTTLDVTVNAVNDNPEAVGDTVTTTESSTVVIDHLLENDTDLDGDSIRIDSFTQPEHGTLVDNGDGTFTYVPHAEYTGTDSFTYTITDDAGGTSTVTVDIVVTPNIEEETEEEEETAAEPDESTDEEDDFLDPGDLQILDPTSDFTGQIEMDAPQVDFSAPVEIEPEVNAHEEYLETNDEIILAEHLSHNSTSETFDPESVEGDFDTVFEEIDLSYHDETDKGEEEAEKERGDWAWKVEQEEQAVTEDNAQGQKGGALAWLWAVLRAGGGLNKSADTQNEQKDKKKRV